jgi:hypothetical protein
VKEQSSAKALFQRVIREELRQAEAQITVVLSGTKDSLLALNTSSTLQEKKLLSIITVNGTHEGTSGVLSASRYRM